MLLLGSCVSGLGLCCSLATLGRNSCCWPSGVLSHSSWMWRFLRLTESLLGSEFSQMLKVAGWLAQSRRWRGALCIINALSPRMSSKQSISRFGVCPVLLLLCLDCSEDLKQKTKRKKKTTFGTAIHFSIFRRLACPSVFLFIRRHYSPSSSIEKFIQ